MDSQLVELVTPWLREKSRAGHAKRRSNYKGPSTWCNGLNPLVADPDTLLHTPPAFGGTLVVLGCGITYMNDATRTMELECTMRSCALFMPVIIMPFMYVMPVVMPFMCVT
jgi:hypothetical protein